MSRALVLRLSTGLPGVHKVKLTSQCVDGPCKQNKCHPIHVCIKEFKFIMKLDRYTRVERAVEVVEQWTLQWLAQFSCRLEQVQRKEGDA